MQPQEAIPLVEAHTIPMYVWIVVYTILLIAGSIMLLKNSYKIDKKNSTLALLWGLGLILLLKLYLSMVTKGFDIDTNCFTAWSTEAGKNMFSMYREGSFFDYPPLFVFFLKMSAMFMEIGIPDAIAIRLPSLLAEIGIGILLYKMATTYFNRTAGLFLAFAYALNPLVILDTTLWGQVDTLLAFFVLLALYLLTENKYIWASVTFAVSILIKPQGIFFLPILIFYLIKYSNIKTIIYSGLAGLGTVIVAVLPFNKSLLSPTTSSTYEHFASWGISNLWHTLTKIPIAKDILWLADRYFGTAEGYKYVAFNSANVYSMLGKNLVEDKEKIYGITYSTLGLILIVIVLIVSVLFYWKSKHNSTPWFIATFLNVGIFMFATRMHERYMFTVIVLLLAAFIYSKDWVTPILLTIFTITNYINVDDVLIRQMVLKYPHIPPDSVLLKFVSFLNLIGFLLLTAHIARLAFKDSLPILKINKKVITRSEIKKEKR